MKKHTSVLLFGTLFLTLGTAAFEIVKNDTQAIQVNAAADDPATYWNDLTATDGSVYGNTFRKQLEDIMVNKGSSNGTNSYSALNNILTKSDTNGGSSVLAFYRNHSASSGWNKEHCWPNSRGAGENSGYAGTDPQVIRPTNSSDNSSRNNYMYGEVANPLTATYSQSTGWDPAAFGYEAARGEAARIILYTAVRYYNKNLSGAGGSYNKTGLVSATSMELTNNLNDATINGTMGKLSDLLHWNTEYAVTDTEQYRNNYLSGAISGSTYDYCRNPFIDHPEWANYIWDNNGIRSTAYSTTSVSVASSSVSVNKGNNVTDQATANNFASTVSWNVASSDSSVATATVSSSGLVTVHGVKGGSATITVSGTDGTTTRTAAIAVTVVSTDPTVTISPFSLSLKVGTNGTATVGNTNFAGSVSYAVVSTSPSVATGSVSGGTLTIVPLSVGSTTLTITGTSGSQSASAVMTVTVNDASSYGDTYNLVTGTDDLTVGEKYLIAASGYDYAVATTQNTNNRGQALLVKNTTEKTATLQDGVAKFTLQVGTSAGTFAFSDGSGYLYAASSSENYLRTETTISANSSWTIAISNEVASIVANGSYTHKFLQYNLSASIFSCYSSASQNPLALYKQGSGGSTDTSAADASSWAASFVTAIGSHCDAAQQAANTPDVNLVNAWAGQQTSFEALSGAAQPLVKADYSSDSNITAARALYNFILGKYGTGSLTNFLGTEVPYAARVTDHSWSSSEEAILFVAAILLAGALGGIFLLRRKKES